jgi:hypothetical protein
MSRMLSRRALMANAAALSALTSACAASAPDMATAPSDALGDSDATGVGAPQSGGELTVAEALGAAIPPAQSQAPPHKLVGPKK